MINDLRIPGVPTWKWVDDTTCAEIVPRGKDSHIQDAVNYVAERSSCNLMQLNAAKCKERLIDLSKCKLSFEPLFINDKNLTFVQNDKILGLTISNNLTWNTHIRKNITEANKRIYFLVLRRKAGVPLFRAAYNFLAGAGQIVRSNLFLLGHILSLTRQTSIIKIILNLKIFKT